MGGETQRLASIKVCMCANQEKDTDTKSSFLKLLFVSRCVMTITAGCARADVARPRVLTSIQNSVPHPVPTR